MEYKVQQFINNNTFQKDKYPDIVCYLESFNLKKGYFNKKEQLELFNYFFDLRKEGVLPYFTNYYRFKSNIITESEIFYEIKYDISEKLDNEIKLILEKSEVLDNDVFNLFDYIVSIYKEKNKDIIIEYIKKSFDKINILINNDINNIKNENNLIFKSLQMLSIIDYLKINDIKEELNNIIKYIYTNSDKVDFSFTVFKLLLRDDILDIDKKDFIYFVISSNNIENRDFMNLTPISLYYDIINKLINKINDIKFLSDIFNDYFPVDKNIYIITYRELLVQFITSKKCVDINEGSIDNVFNEELKNYLLIYVGYIYNSYQYNNQEGFVINLDDYSGLKIDLTYLLKEVKKYISILSKTDGFPRKFDYIWSKRLFKEYVNSIAVYNTCSKSAKKFRIELIDSENDPLFNIKDDNEELLKKIKYNLSNEAEAKKKKEKIDKEQEKEKLNCIDKFFSLYDIRKDFIKIIEQFDENILKSGEFSLKIDNRNEFWRYSNIEEYLNKNIDILNPFLISYIKNISFYFYKNKIDLQEIFYNVINNWNKYYILHLYNYLISIKKYDYNFHIDKKKEIINYFHNKEIKFPKYVLIHVEKVFGFDLKLKDLFDDNTIIDILKTNYSFIQFNEPKEILIYKNITVYPEINYVIEEIDFSSFFKTYNINTYNILNKALSNIDMKNAALFGSQNYYLFLSIINLYNILDKKKVYKEKLINLLKEYFYNNISINDYNTIPNLVIRSIENLDLVGNILEIILDSISIKSIHYSILSKWDDDIFYNNLYKKEYLNIIYDIRQKIREDKIIIMDYNDSTNIDNEKYNENINYYKSDNIVNLLKFINKDNTIFEEYCKFNITYYYLQEESIKIFRYLFNNNLIDKEVVEYIVTIIIEIYPKLPKRIDYFLVEDDTMKFELKAVIDNFIDILINSNLFISDKILNKLIKMFRNLNIDNINILYINNIIKRLTRKDKSVIVPIKIYLQNKEYIVKNKYDTIEYRNTDEDPIIKYILNKFNASYNISRLFEFEYLIKDMKEKIITLSHPYLFEDELENNYSTNKKLFISCFSYSTGHQNAYAWWKIYGSRTKFRMTVDIESFLRSIISILRNQNNIEIYLGSIEYLMEHQINRKKNTNEWDFFEKRNDFEFENELRVMIKIISNTNKSKVDVVKGLPVLGRFKLDNFDIYKNMSTNMKDIIFHPYDKTLLKKDKIAMKLQISKYKKIFSKLKP
ncbi:hypothetical protein [Brachyspira pilosicoli]|uniref:hypothetical protein n=1 Tax=Brachyspira pilosicoli TaxID=52584 RepID=UPI0030043646